MKKFFVPFLAAAMTLVGCVNTELEERVDKLESEVDAIKVELARLNSSISAFQTSIDALKLNDYVTSVVEVKENGVVIGYKLSFANSGDVIVYHGAKGDKGDQGDQGDKGDKGEAGKASIVSVTLIDGVYYWTLDGKVLTDENGNKLSVTGNAPELKIDEVNGEKHLLVSYDGGKTWFDLGQAGDNFFQAVYKTEDDSAVVFELKDGQKIEIPLVPAFALACEATTASFEEETVTIKYKVNGADAADEVVVFVYYTSAGLTAEIGDKNALEGEVVIKADDITSFKNGLVALQAINNTTGAVSGQAITLLGEVVSVDITEAVLVGHEGGNVEIKVKTNTAELTATSNAAWLTKAPAAKAEMREETVTFTASPNDGNVRTATITLAGTLGAVQNITVIQETLPLDEVVKNSTLILGDGNGFDGVWEILENADYCIYLDRPTFAMSAAAANLFDGDLTSKDGTWFAKFDSQNDDPITFVVDMKSVVAPSVFYAQHFSDTQTYKKFKFYIAENYDGEKTEWTLVAEADGTQQYMTAPEFDIQGEVVNNASGATQYKAYDLTYAIPCQKTMFGRYLKVEIPTTGLDGLGKGKMNEIYMKGMYKNPEDKPLEVKEWLGYGNWKVIKGEEYSLYKDPSGKYSGDWYTGLYPISNLVDGVWYNHGSDLSYGGNWGTWFEQDIPFPLSIVIKLDAEYIPFEMHVHDGNSHQGQFQSWNFYIADEYDGENTVWKPILEWRNRGYTWVTGGSDYKAPVTKRESGKYLRCDIVEPNSTSGDFLHGRGYLGEIYFYGHKVPGSEVNPSVPAIQVNGAGDYATINDAVAATAGVADAVITLADGTYTELVAVGAGDGKVTIQPAAGATNVVIDGGVHTRDRELVVKNVTINANKALTYDAANNLGIRPLSTDSDSHGAKYQHYPTTIVVEQGTTKAVLFENCTINTNDEVKAASGTLFYPCPTTAGAAGLTIKNCTINAEGTRVCQSYGGVSIWDGNTINGSYSSYAIRMGGATGATGAITVTNNTINTTAPTLDIHSSVSNNAASTITWGDGTKETNTFAAGTAVVIKGSLSGITCNPANLTAGAAYAIPE